MAHPLAYTRLTVPPRARPFTTPSWIQTGPSAPRGHSFLPAWSFSTRSIRSSWAREAVRRHMLLLATIAITSRTWRVLALLPGRTRTMHSRSRHWPSRHGFWTCGPHLGLAHRLRRMGAEQGLRSSVTFQLLSGTITTWNRIPQTRSVTSYQPPSRVFYGSRRSLAHRLPCMRFKL